MNWPLKLVFEYVLLDKYVNNITLSHQQVSSIFPFALVVLHLGLLGTKSFSTFGTLSNVSSSHPRKILPSETELNFKMIKFDQGGRPLMTSVKYRKFVTPSPHRHAFYY